MGNNLNLNMTFHDLCGKEISARGFAVHVKHCTGKDWQPKASSKKRYANRVKRKNKDSLKEYGNDVKPKKLKSLPETNNITDSNISIKKDIVKSINLKGEFETMSEQVNPKSKVSDEPKYECGQCHTKFNDKMKYCPSCGIEFA